MFPYHRRGNLEYISLLNEEESTWIVLAASQDEEGQGKDSSDDGADTVCPFALLLLNWKVAKGVHIVFEH